MVEKNATPILNNLPLRYKIKEKHNFIEVGKIQEPRTMIKYYAISSRKRSKVSFPTLFKYVSSSIMN